jgi:pentafunctional AROM polypeptide
MCQDVDAMEYRADLLDCRDSRFDLIYGMQLLRRYCRPHCVRVPALPFGQRVLEDVMPIVYTVRTQNQAGTFPDDDAGIDRMFQMLEWGLRAGVEVLDVESAWDKGKVDALLTLAQDRYSSQILGSEHVLGKQITTEEAVALFHQCAFGGRAHGAKVVLSVEEEGRDRMAYEAALIATELARADGRPVIPNISLVLGDVGKFSRVVNLAFTPVTHRLLPKKAAPGQMTSTEIMTTRLLTKIFTPKKFCILGHNIEYSVSPQMQGAAFAASQLPHDYIRVDTAAVEEFIESDFFKSDDFGGASVTIPHKQSIMPYVDALSVAAKEIGSVNTLIVREEFADGEGFKRVIYGDNTDWRGIYKPLRRRSSTSMKSSDFALILGAGGTARAAAYAANKLGLKCIFYNRTPSKADDLVDSFGGRAISSLADTSSSGAISLGDVLTQASGSSLRVVINTTPAAAELLLPDWLLLRRNHRLPIVFDVNYKPFNTKLLLQAEAAGCSVVRGSEMLWEQGAGQFELWTERTAPYSVMKRVVLDNCAEVIS